MNTDWDRLRYLCESGDLHAAEDLLKHARRAGQQAHVAVARETLLASGQVVLGLMVYQDARQHEDVTMVRGVVRRLMSRSPDAVTQQLVPPPCLEPWRAAWAMTQAWATALDLLDGRCEEAAFIDAHDVAQQRRAAPVGNLARAPQGHLERAAQQLQMLFTALDTDARVTFEQPQAVSARAMWVARERFKRLEAVMLDMLSAPTHEVFAELAQQSLYHIGAPWTARNALM